MADGLMAKKQLPVVEIPGLAEARRREADRRDFAFLGIPESIMGVKVRPLSPRLLLVLDRLKNGFVVPCTFESSAERCAHAKQFLWVISYEYRVPVGFVDYCLMRFRRYRFGKRIDRLNGFDLFTSISAYIEDAFADCIRAPEGMEMARVPQDRKSTRLNSSHISLLLKSRMPSSA